MADFFYNFLLCPPSFDDEPMNPKKIPPQGWDFVLAPTI